MKTLGIMHPTLDGKTYHLIHEKCGICDKVREKFKQEYHELWMEGKKEFLEGKTI